MNENINFLNFFYNTGKSTEESYPSQIVDFFPALVFVYDLEHEKVSFSNRKFSSYFGLNAFDRKDRENLLSRLFEPEDWQHINEDLAKFILLNEDEMLSFCSRLKSKQGTSELFKVMTTVLRRDYLGKASSLLFICQDIIRDIKINGDSQSRKKLFDETEELLHFGTWTFFVDEDIMEWSSGLSLMLGYEKSPQVTTQMMFISHIADYDKEVFERCIGKAIEEKADFEIEVSVRTRSGEEKIFLTQGEVNVNSKNVVEHIVGITRDVTDLRKSERQQDHAIRELNRSNQELEEFAYVASHDMQEPLRKISMFGERLHDKLKGKLDNESELYLKRIMSSATNMKGLIDHLLEFSRTNRRSNNVVACDLNNLLVQVLADLDLKIEESKSVIKIEEKLPVLEASAAELAQLFTNLLSNAIKFRKPDCHPVINIAVRELTKDEKLQMKLKADRIFYRFDVNDNGIGFEQEYADRIFLIFQRLNGKSEFPGSGIGLAICKKIVDNHSGIIFAASEPGQGSTFTVILPEKQI